MFDPDYRAVGWNKSRYAPKNYGGSRRGRKATPMTDLARIFAGIVGLASYFGLYNLKVEALTSFGIAFVAAFIVFIFVGTTIYRREKRYVESLLNDKNGKTPESETPIEHEYKYHKMKPEEFEEHVAWIITNSTSYSAKRVGGSGDGGVDIEVFKGHRKVGVIQCKRYKPSKSLPPSFIRELATVRAIANVETAYLVTNAKFSKQSRETAKTLGIRLIDGKKLRQIDATLHA